MFERYGDDRDGGLSRLDESSSEEFDKWYDLSWDEKWKIENPSHMWELREGSSRTRIHLTVMNDENGYYLVLSGRNHYMTDEIVKMFIALRENNVSVVLYDIEKIKGKILGSDEVGVIAEYEEGLSYTYGGFEKNHISNFVKIEEIPEENREEFIESVDWFPLEKVEKAS